jgi:hypothetical protein
MLLRRYATRRVGTTASSPISTASRSTAAGRRRVRRRRIRTTCGGAFPRPCSPTTLFTVVANNATNVDPQLRGISGSAGAVGSPPAAGQSGVELATDRAGDGFYVPAAYRGAFDARDNWLRGWTSLALRGIPGSVNKKSS